jgi:DNA replication licensing factor MCM5
MDEAGWNVGRVYTTATFAGDENEDSMQAIMEKFLDFLRSFRIDQVFIYRYNEGLKLETK